MNYRVEQITLAGNGHPERFLGIPFLTDKEKIIFSLINPLYFTKIKGTGLAEGYGCSLDKKTFEIEIITGERKLNVEAAEKYAEEILAEFRKEFEPILDSPTVLSNAIDLLRFDAYAKEAYEINKNLIKLACISDIRKKLDKIESSYANINDYQVIESFLVPTVNDMNNIQVKLRNDVIDLQSNLSKVAANLDYYTKDLKDTYKNSDIQMRKIEADIKESMDLFHEQFEGQTKFQETLNHDFQERLNTYDDWVEKKLKPKMSLVDTLNLEYVKDFNRISRLEKQILLMQTPWYAKLWDKLTIFWSNM